MAVTAVLVVVGGVGDAGGAGGSGGAVGAFCLGLGALLAITLSLRGTSFALKFLRTSCNARISHSTW